MASRKYSDGELCRDISRCKRRNRHSNENKVSERELGVEATERSPRYKRRNKLLTTDTSGEFQSSHSRKYTARGHNRQELEHSFQSVMADFQPSKIVRSFNKRREELVDAYHKSLTITTSGSGIREVAVSPRVVRVASSKGSSSCSCSSCMSDNRFSSEETSSIVETSATYSHDDFSGGRRKNFSAKSHPHCSGMNENDLPEKIEKVIREDGNFNSREVYSESSSISHKKISEDKFSSKNSPKSPKDTKISPTSEMKLGLGRGILTNRFSEISYNESLSSRTGHHDPEVRRSTEVKSFQEINQESNVSTQNLSPKCQFSLDTANKNTRRRGLGRGAFIKKLCNERYSCGKAADDDFSLGAHNEESSSFQKSSNEQVTTIVDNVIETKIIPEKKQSPQDIIKKLCNDRCYKRNKTSDAELTLGVQSEQESRSKISIKQVASTFEQTVETSTTAEQIFSPLKKLKQADVELTLDVQSEEESSPKNFIKQVASTFEQTIETSTTAEQESSPLKELKQADVELTLDVQSEEESSSKNSIKQVASTFEQTVETSFTAEQESSPLKELKQADVELTLDVQGKEESSSKNFIKQVTITFEPTVETSTTAEQESSPLKELKQSENELSLDVQGEEESSSKNVFELTVETSTIAEQESSPLKELKQAEKELKLDVQSEEESSSKNFIKQVASTFEQTVETSTTAEQESSPLKELKQAENEQTLNVQGKEESSSKNFIKQVGSTFEQTVETSTTAEEESCPLKELKQADVELNLVVLSEEESSPKSSIEQVASRVEQTITDQKSRPSSSEVHDSVSPCGIGRGIELKNSSSSELSDNEISDNFVRTTTPQNIDKCLQKTSNEDLSTRLSVEERGSDSVTESTSHSANSEETKGTVSGLGRGRLLKKLGIILDATHTDKSPLDVSIKKGKAETDVLILDQSNCKVTPELYSQQQEHNQSINDSKSDEKQEIVPATVREPEDRSNFLSNITQACKFGLFGKFLSKIVGATTEEELNTSTEKHFMNESSTIELESTKQKENAETPEIITSKQLSDDKEESSLIEEEILPDEQQIPKEGGELCDKKQVQGQDDAQMYDSLCSSRSAADDTIPIERKYEEDGTTSTSDLNRDSDEESMATEKEEIDYHHAEVLSKISHTGSVIHGDIQIALETKVNNLHVHNLIMKNLEYRRITDLTRCQQVVIPIVAKEHNLVLVGPPGTKKTSAWLIPMLNNLLNDKRVEPKKSPKCIIIVPGSNRVRYIARLCSSYVGAKLAIIGTHGGGLELERKDELLSGVDILISTPRCCLRLFKSNFVITPDRLKYFVIDSAEDILKRFSHEINLLKNGINYLTKVREHFDEDSKLQIILAGTTWTDEVENIALNWLKKPVICITSYLEAAIYSRINMKMHLMKMEAKVNQLLEMISNNNSVRTVIVCCDCNDVKQLRAKLSSLPRRTVLVAHEEMHHSLLPDIGEEWTNANNVPLLICTDFILHELNISNAKWLIHYTLPMNKSDFRDRFSFIRDCLVDRIKNVNIQRANCNIDIFIDENTESHLPKIVEILDRLQLPVSEELRTKVKEIEKMKELDKIGEMFCENILQFGHCWKPRCKMRHLIIQSKDAPQLEPPIKSFVTMEVIDVISPTHLIARLKSYTMKLFSTDAISLASKFFYIALRLAELYMDKSKRCMHGRTAVGDVVGVCLNEDEFARGKVLEISARDQRSNATEVYLYLLDKGTYKTEKTENLLSLPTELQVLPGEAVNIYITGLLPLDLDRCWSYTANKYIKQKVMGFQSDDTRIITVIAQVELILGKNILVEKVLFYEEPPHGFTSPWLIESLRQLIISSNFGILNHEHKKILRKFAVDAGITLSEEVMQKLEELPKESVKEELRWAYLPADIDEHLVNVIVIDDLETIFVRRITFHKCLLALEQDLTTIMNKEAIKLEEYNIGTFCAVKSAEDNRFNRGMIIEPKLDAQPLEESEVEVFALDYGERLTYRKNAVYALPEGFISRLPFQAIECGLAGINQVDEEETITEGVDMLYNLVSDEHKLHKIYLKVINVEKEGKSDSTGGFHYEVALLLNTVNRNILINEEMVNCEFAHWIDDMKEEILDFKNRFNTESASEYVAEPISDEEEDNDNSEKEYNPAVETLESLNESVVQPESLEEETAVQTFSALPKQDLNLEEININKAECVGPFFEQTIFSSLFPSDMLKLLKNINNRAHEEKPAVVIEEIVDTETQESKTNDTKLPPLEEQGEKENDDDDTCYIKRLALYSPTVYWRQSSIYVWLKILIPDVKLFQLNWTDSYINFQSIVDDKHYWVDIDLFGTINPDTVMHKITGLYFEIRFTKLLTGYRWPRIFYNVNTKARNILHDPHMVVVDDDWEDESLIPSYVARSEKNKTYSNVDVDENGNNHNKKVNCRVLDDNSSISGESDIDDFIPIPDAMDNLYED